jgi:hypothetical protein
MGIQGLPVAGNEKPPNSLRGIDDPRRSGRVRRGRLILLGVVPLLLTEAAGWAQERPNGVYLTSPLSLGSGYDSSFVVGSRAQSDTVVILTGPTFSWLKTTHRTRVSADYEPEFEIFSRYRDLNAWDHSATMRYSYQVDSRTSLDAGDSYLSTADASRSLADSQFLLPRGRFQQNSFFVGLKYRFGHRTQLFFRFDNAITTMTLEGAHARAIDQMTNAGTVTLDHTIDRHHSVTGSYAYLRVRPLDPNGPAGYSNQGVHALNAGYMYTVNPGLNFRAAGGVIRGSAFAYTGGGAVEKQLGGLWLMAGYQRYLSFFGGFAPIAGPSGGAAPFANGTQPNSLFQAASLRLRGQLTRRAGLALNGQRGSGSIGNRSVRTLIAQSRVDYKLSERLSVFASAEYYGQNVGQFSETPLSRRRYFGGLEIVLSRPPDLGNTPRPRGNVLGDHANRQAAETHLPEEK